MPERPRFERKSQSSDITLIKDKARPDCLGYGLLGACSEREKTSALRQVMTQELHTGRTRLI